MNVPPLFQAAVSAAVLCLWVISAAADQPLNILQDCPSCPKMIAVPAGEFLMGSPAHEPYRGADEGPQHLVKIAESFMVGIYEVTFDEWEAYHLKALAPICLATSAGAVAKTRLSPASRRLPASMKPFEHL